MLVLPFILNYGAVNHPNKTSKRSSEGLGAVSFPTELEGKMNFEVMSDLYLAGLSSMRTRR